MDAALTALFLAALAAPTIDEYARPPEARGPEKHELRAAAKRPTLYADPRAIKRFPRAYEDWYLDTFGLRDHLLRAGSIEKLFLFGVSPTPVVDLGRDGWMFYRENASREVHRGRLPFQPRELANWQRMFQNHAEVCASLGAAHLLVIGPNKETIYPEKLPESWNEVGPSRLEQLDAWLTEHGATARFLDLRPALQAEKANDKPGDHVYYELGTHWNGRGVYTAYREILSALAPRVPGLAPLPLERFARVIGPDSGDSWARAMYIDDLVPQTSHRIVAAPTRVQEFQERGVRVWISEGKDPSLPRAVMFHDSFGQSIMFQLAPHFSRFAAYWTGDISDAVLQRERPDVVLEVFVERYLVHYAPQEHLIGTGDLSKGLFESSGRPLFVLAPGNVETLAGRGGARVEAGAAPALARIEFPTAASLVHLPRFRLPVEGDLLLRAEIETERPGELLVLPVWTGETEPRRRQTGRNSFGAGTSTVYLRIPRSSKLAGLALRFTLDGGVVLVRSLEVRGMPGT